MKNIRNLSLLATSTPLTFKSFLRKPLRFLIQMVTGSRIEHVALYCQKKVLQSSGRGVELIPFDEWLEHYKNSKIFKFQFTRKLKLKEILYFHEFAKIHAGKDYSAFQAAYSALDLLPIFRELDLHSQEEMFCSKLCAKFYEDIGWIKIDEAKTNPKELIHQLNSLHLTNGRERCKKK